MFPFTTRGNTFCHYRSCQGTNDSASLPCQNHSLFLFKNLRLIHHFFFLFLNTIKYFLIYLNQWLEKLGGNFTRSQCPVEANAFSRLRVFSCRKQREYFEWSSEIQAPWFLLPSRKNVTSALILLRHRALRVFTFSHRSAGRPAGFVLTVHFKSEPTKENRPRETVCVHGTVLSNVRRAIKIS